MQNNMMNSLTRLVPTFALAAMTAGCSTMSQTTEHSCMVGKSVKSELAMAFIFQANTPDQYSNSCTEGKVAAQTVYLGQDVNGNLRPGAALLALEIDKDVQEKINTSKASGDKTTQKYYEDVGYFFNIYLKQLGGQTVDSIRKTVDKLKADIQKANSTVPAEPEPKPVPRCGNGPSILRTCKAIESAAPSVPSVQ